MSNYAIKVNNVSKKYGKTAALINADIEFKPNKIYGLLGRNGAGKTTLINAITNKIFVNNGNITIFGEQARENDKAQAKIFCMSAKGYYPYDTKVCDVYKWLKRFYPALDIEYAYSLAEKFNLNLKKKMKDLSTGYDTIARTIPVLASNAEIAIFDEPTLGLDANHRDLFYKELISVYSKNPATYIVSTHLIDEIADVLEEIVIIDNGKVVLAKRAEELLALGYTVTGLDINIDKYIVGKTVLNTQSLGSLKSAMILGERSESELKDIKQLNISISQARLQEIFIQLTNSHNRS